MTNKQTNTNTIIIRLRQDQYNKVKRNQFNTNETVSNIIRNLIDTLN